MRVRVGLLLYLILLIGRLFVSQWCGGAVLGLLLPYFVAVVMSRDGKAQLFIGRLSRDVRTEDLERIFSRYGKLDRCDIKMGTGVLAYGFVDFEDKRDAEDAIHYEHGREFEGNRIVVEWAKGPGYRASAGYGFSRYGGRGGGDRGGGRGRDEGRGGGYGGRGRSRSRSPVRRRSRTPPPRRRSFSGSPPRSRSRSRS